MSERTLPEGLPPGWTMEVKACSTGKKYKCYIDPSSQRRFYSKAAVSRYLRKSPIALGEEKKIESVENHQEKVVIEKVAAEGLPPGWKKEIRVKQRGHRIIRRDAYYTDPITGYIFRSMKGVLQYLDTGELGKFASKPKDRGCGNMEMEEDKGSSLPQTEGQQLSTTVTTSQINEQNIPSDAGDEGTNLGSPRLLDDKNIEKIESKDDIEKNEYPLTPPPAAALAEKTSLDTCQMSGQGRKRKHLLHKSEDKKEDELPRRSSKRLAAQRSSSAKKSEVIIQISSPNSTEKSEATIPASSPNSVEKPEMTTIQASSPNSTEKPEMTTIQASTPNSAAKPEMTTIQASSPNSVAKPEMTTIQASSPNSTAKSETAQASSPNSAPKPEVTIQASSPNSAAKPEMTTIQASTPIATTKTEVIIQSYSTNSAPKPEVIIQASCPSSAPKPEVGSSSSSYADPTSQQVDQIGAELDNKCNNGETSAISAKPEVWVNAEKHAGAMEPENKVDEKQECTVASPLQSGPISAEKNASEKHEFSPDEHPEKVHATQTGDETKEMPTSEPHLDLPFGHSWTDPCIEFAVKTLTGALPVSDDLDMQYYFDQHVGSLSPGNDSFRSSGQVGNPSPDDNKGE